MNYSIELYALSHRPRKDKKIPVNIRIGYRSEYIFFNTKQFISKADLNKNGKIKNQMFIHALEPQMQEYRSIIESLDESRVKDVKDIKMYIVKGIKLSEDVNFLSFFSDVLDEMKKKNFKSLHIYKAVYNHLIAFTKQQYRKEVLSMDKITLELLTDFEEYLRNKGVGYRGLNLYMVRFKTIYMQCLGDYEDYGKMFRNGFRKYKIPADKPPKTKALTREQLQAIIKLDLTKFENSQMARRAQLAFIISLLTLGTNATDLYDMKPSKNGRIEYKRNKTKDRRDNEAFISIKIEPELIPYLKMTQGYNGYLFNFRDHNENKQQFNKTLNLGLEKIAYLINLPYWIKNLKSQGVTDYQINRLKTICLGNQKIKIIRKEGLSEKQKNALFDLGVKPELITGLFENEFIHQFNYYDARRTVASTMRNKLGIRKDDIADCLNHVDPEHRLTDRYIEVDFSILDRCNRKFIDWLYSKDSK